MKDSARFAVTGYQHAPGPWEVVYRDDSNFMCMTCIAPSGAMGNTSNVCRLEDDPNNSKIVAATYHQLSPWVGIDAFEREQDEANARLIAAAPDLLEALKVIVDLPFQFPCGLLEQALDAIEKATGQGKFEEENE